VDGVGHVPGATMFEKMCHLRNHADALRRARRAIKAPG
jgi:hypothetical protein